jgi:epoxide hydrolase-like predicted phosphatase
MQVRAVVFDIGGVLEDTPATGTAGTWEARLRLRPGGTLNTELAIYFGGLRPRYRTALLSNSFVGARQREQERYRFGDITDLIVYSHEVGMAKPDPRIYRLTCERLGVRPEHAVFLDDRAECVDGALQTGMRAILYEDNEQAIADLEAALR